MICMIKSEIHKDKDVVILDLLLKLFNKHTNLYYKYRSLITNHKNVLNQYILLLFELIEAMFFYFLEPAKPILIDSIPMISRKILEDKIWVNKNYR